MALLGTYIDVAVVSLAGYSLVCVGHSLPTRPDWCGYTSLYTIGHAVALVTRGDTAAIWFNYGGTSVPGEQLLLFAHSIIR